MGELIEGVLLTRMAIIKNVDGDVLHAIRTDSPGYRAFGEAYFSMVGYRSVKAWKRHRLMTLNILVPIGEIRFAIHDNRPGSSSRGRTSTVILSRDNYQRLTIPPGLWVGFQGLGRETNILLDVADIAHNPAEADQCPADAIDYDWRTT